MSYRDFNRILNNNCSNSHKIIKTVDIYFKQKYPVKRNGHHSQNVTKITKRRKRHRNR